MNCTQRSPILTFVFITSSLFSIDSIAQKKFEFGLRFDALNIPFDNSVESGLGFYDINASQEITQAGYVDFAFWPDRHLGLSLGVGMRDFKSGVSYPVPEPLNIEEEGAVNTYYFNTRSFGLTAALQFRKDRLRGRIGLSTFDHGNPDYNRTSRSAFSTTWDQNGVIADLDLTEEAFWSIVPGVSNLVQLDIQYNVINNLYFKVGFETTLGGRKVYPYELRITGYTEDMPKEERVLNHFKVRNTYTAVSVGVAYMIGFGGYRI